MRAAILVATFAIGCAGPRKAYLDTLDRHTEMLLVSKDVFGTALRLRGTYLSPGFRDAMADERKRLMGVTDGDHTAFQTRMAEDVSSYHEVVFTAESALANARIRFGDDDRGWRIRLEADGTVEPLVQVTQVRSPSPLHEAIYAHLNMWNTLWIARFERTVDRPRTVTFHVGSGHGHDVLVFEGDAVR